MTIINIVQWAPGDCVTIRTIKTTVCEVNSICISETGKRKGKQSNLPKGPTQGNSNASDTHRSTWKG